MAMLYAQNMVAHLSWYQGSHQHCVKIFVGIALRGSVGPETFLAYCFFGN